MSFNFSVFQRLLISFGIMTLLVVAAAGAGFWFTAFVEESHAAMLQFVLLADKVNHLQTTWSQIISAADQVLLTQNTTTLEDEFNQLVITFTEEFVEIYNQPLGLTPETNATNHSILEGLSGLKDDLNAFNQEFVDAAQAGQWGSAFTLRGTRLALLQTRLEEQLEILGHNIQMEVTDAVDAAARVRNVSRLYWLVITIAVVGFAIATSLMASRSIVKPINQLTKTVASVSRGDLSPIEPMTQRDEIGNLSRTFALLTNWLRESYETLEKRVDERTVELETRTVQIQVAAEVARDITYYRDLKALLDQAVDIIRERFGFYHAGIFMVDDRNEFAVLEAATGGAGKLMVTQEHRLKIGETGLVGHVANTGEPRIALDVGKDSVHFKNPLLPRTRSEVALPLKIAGRVIGILDVQSRDEAAFDDDSLTILGIIADQLSIAIENARLLEEFQKNLQELEELHEGYSHQVWERFTRESPVSGYKYDGITVTPLQANSIPTDHLEGMLSPPHPEQMSRGDDSNQKTPLSYPLEVRGQVIGTVDVWPQAEKLSASEEYLLEALTNRVSLFLESSRLFEDAQHRARFEQLTGEVTSQIRASLNLETVLRTATEEIYKALDLDHLVIQLTPESLIEENAPDQSVESWTSNSEHTELPIAE